MARHGPDGDLSIVGNLQTSHRQLTASQRGKRGELAVVAYTLQRNGVIGHPSARQPHFAGHFAQTIPQPVEGAEIEIAGTPLEGLDAVEGVRFQPLDEIGRERLNAARDTKRPIVHVAAGAARDLAQFGGREITMNLAVELARTRKSDMIDIEIEAHADGICRDQEINVARLIQRHLRVARARAEGTQHDSGSTALAAHQFGNCVYLGCRECHNGRARRQASVFFPGIRQFDNEAGK